MYICIYIYTHSCAYVSSYLATYQVLICHHRGESLAQKVCNRSWKTGNTYTRRLQMCLHLLALLRVYERVKELTIHFDNSVKSQKNIYQCR